LVVGSQIRGASISSALAVSVVDAKDIEVMGVESGDELFQLIPENGQNFFSEAENFTDERAPLADRYFRYFADAHTEYGRYMYADVRMSF
jgi:hypothetical protein